MRDIFVARAFGITNTQLAHVRYVYKLDYTNLAVFASTFSQHSVYKQLRMQLIGLQFRMN